MLRDIESDLPEGAALQALARAPFALVVTNARRSDNPIAYVNAAFEAATGYDRSAVVGRNCRFLQGPDTDPRTVARIRNAVAGGNELMTDILNYRADGSPFWNRLMIAPLSGPDGAPDHFVGVQKVLQNGPEGQAAVDVALREIQHRVKNHLTMVVGMIRLQARGSEPGGTVLDTLARRVETLQFLYDELGSRNGENSEAVALGAYLGRICNAIAHLDGRSGVRVNVDVEAFTAPMQTAVRLGLILSEVLTNALKYAFEGRVEGLVAITVHETTDGGIRLRIADDGVGVPEGARSGLGTRIVRELAGALGARLDTETGPSGTVVTLCVPPAAHAFP